MNSNYEIPESVVIVRNDYGAVATLLFKNKKKDKIISSSSTKPTSIYRMIEDYVMEKPRYVKKAE